MYLLVVLGFFCVVSPKKAWLLMNGWMYKDVEPDKTVLLITRISGVVAIIIVVVILL